MTFLSLLSVNKSFKYIIGVFQLHTYPISLEFKYEFLPIDNYEKLERRYIEEKVETYQKTGVSCRETGNGERALRPRGSGV